jgi:hypothetical protein
MFKVASLSGEELIKSKEADSRNIVDSSLSASLGRKAGLAAIGYMIGNKIGGPKVGKAGAYATLAYSVPKLIQEGLKKKKAKDFLDMAHGEKLSVIREEEDKKRFGAKNLLGAYVGKRVFDNVIGPETVNVKQKRKAKEKFKIQDAL